MTFTRAQPNYGDLRAVVAEGTSPIVVWVGAGLSVDAGLPTWADLRRLLVAAGEQKAAEMDPGDKEPLDAELKAVALNADYWVAFERLKAALGDTTFTATIRSALSTAHDVAIPPAYELIWRLGAKAVLSLNLDNLAVRAHASVHGGSRNLLAKDGRRTARVDGYMQRTNDVVANMHGTVEDSSSWVLCRGDLNSLLRDAPYVDFVKRLINGYTNIFLGMSADDQAVAGHLDALKNQGVEFSQCFWLSNRRDTQTDAWAESAGMRLIRYSAEPDHSTVIQEFLKELIDARPEPEAAPPPVRPTVDDEVLLDLATEPLPDVGKLIAMPADQVRRHLNGEATRLLAVPGEHGRAEYDAFCLGYEEAIYRAWYVSTAPGANHLMGFRVKEEVAAGAFGRVFRAVDSQGEEVAIKLLRHEIRAKRELLDSFRRGVRSMEILSRRGVQSMVRYRAATEIPSMVVMDWVDGPNLAQAKDARSIDDWDSILKICADLTTVILNAHRVPERVLHRDLRPANVMLRGFWVEPNAYEVVVLDFDLSWHQGAENRSVQYSTALGYLAPEQRGVTSGSTRHAAVDVYGLGMTFWYLLTGRDPVPDQHMHTDFRDVTHDAAARIPGTAWRSLPRRFAELVCWMTRNLQGERPDVPRVLDELKALIAANAEGGHGVPLELRVEELASRTEYFTGYAYDADSKSFLAQERRGIQARLKVDTASGGTQLQIAWARTGIEERRGLNKYANRAEEAVRARLSAGGWAVASSRNAGQSFEISATHSMVGASNVGGLAEGLDAALGQIRFD